MSAKEFLNKLEVSLENLSFGKVVDVGNIDLIGADFLKNSYEGIYNIECPLEDNFNPGKYAIAFYLKGEKQNA